MPCLFSRRARRRIWGNYCSISLTSIPRKITEPIFLEAVCEHMKDRRITGNSQHGFTMVRLCLNSPTMLCGEMTGPVNKGSGVNIVYLDCSKALNSLPLNSSSQTGGKWTGQVDYSVGVNWLDC